MRLPFAALAVLCGCAAARGGPEAAYVASLRDEARALRRIEGLVAWQEGTRGERPAVWGALVGHEALAGRTALEALSRAEQAAGLSAPERLSLRFLRRSLAARAVGQATADLDARIAHARLGGDPPGPLLREREAAAQRGARAIGYRDYIALSEDVREVDLSGLLADGTAYLRATEASFRRALDRVAREELSVPREGLRASDLPRLLQGPTLLLPFPAGGEVAALRSFLAGIGLNLTTSAGTEVVIDDEQRPNKRARAFTSALDGPRDVRVSVQRRGGLDGYGALFHEAGHALHFGWSDGPRELTELGHLAPSEAFGELFRSALADADYLRRARPGLSPLALAGVLRRAALAEMLQVRRTAFARIAFELRLHGRPASEVSAALALLPDAAAAEGDLRELYRQLFSVASGVLFTSADAARFLTDVDDTFYAADHARAFALAALLDQELRARFGSWTSRREVGAFLKRELFAHGRARSVAEVAARLGHAPRLDFALAARRAERLLAQADALEAAP